MEKLAIIGCGTMGHSIALSIALADMEVTMYGVDDADTERGLSGIQEKLKVLVQNGFIHENQTELVRKKIIASTSMNKTIAGKTFIIETIPENLTLKKKLFEHLDKCCDEHTILASNTSSLSPTAIASGVSRPQRIIVTHFWNPAHLVPLVELVRIKETSDLTMKRSMDLLQKLKKKPIEVKKDIPGFVGNRLQFALFREAQYLLEEGVASKEDIDAAVTYGIGRRLPVTGPLLSADMGGLDVFAAISDYLFRDLSNANGSLPTLRKLVEDKKFGAKNGEGYYKWNRTSIDEMNQKRESELIRFLSQDSETET